MSQQIVKFINWITNQPLAFSFVSPPSNVVTVRNQLTTTTTVFIDQTNGNDSNDGSTTALAFKTLQAAYNYIAANFDFAGQTVVMQCASGQVITNVLVMSETWTGGGNLVLDLGTSTINPVSPASGAALISNCPNSGIFSVRNGTIECTTSGGGLVAQNGGLVIVGSGITFGAVPNTNFQVVAQNNGIILFSANYTISGGGTGHYASLTGGLIGISAGFTVTVTGTPAFTSEFALAQDNGNISISSVSVTYSGAATGVRFLAQTGGMIDTVGGGANFFPGNSAGSAVTGTYGIYV